jgi:hypothetical protein
MKYLVAPFNGHIDKKARSIIYHEKKEKKGGSYMLYYQRNN